MNPAGKSRSSVHRMKRVGMAGHALSGHGLRPGVSDWRRPLVAHGLLGQGAGNVMVERDERIMAAGLAAVSPGLLGHDLRQAGMGGPIQFPFHQVPVPAHVGGAMDQRERGHFIASLARAMPASRRPAGAVTTAVPRKTSRTLRIQVG